MALLGVGCVLALGAGVRSLLVAVLLAGCIVLYDAKGKRIEYVGSFNMGCCRFLNVVLGASGAAPLQPETWLWSVLPVALLVLLYISAVTLLATGEVWGGNRTISSLVFGAIVVVIGGVVWLGLAERLPSRSPPCRSWPCSRRPRCWWSAGWSARRRRRTSARRSRPACSR